MKVTTTQTKTFGPCCGPCRRTMVIPAGLPVVEIKEGGTKGCYFLNVFPKDLFPPGSIARHDAEHYGIVFEPDEVTEVT